MSFVGIDSLEWAALGAIGGLALAAAAVATLVVTVRMARADRQRDDIKRQEDRQWDADRRKEEREWDAEQRRQDRERDDRLRAEAAEAWEQRTRAERHEREDYEARQVTVEVFDDKPPFESIGHDLNHRIIVSTPAAYPIKQVNAQVVHWTGSNMGIRPIGHGGDRPSLENGRVYHRFWAGIPDLLQLPAVIVQFVDQHGNLYYNYLHQTWRFPQDTDWPAAAARISQWVRLGPGVGPGEPDA